MKVSKSKVTSVDGTTYVDHFNYDFNEITDTDHFNPMESNVTVDLERCPFCGTTGMLNCDSKGWYGWCSICDSQGPHHWNWVKAAKMWNDHSFKTVYESFEMKPDSFKSMDQDRLSDKAKQFLKEVK